MSIYEVSHGNAYSGDPDFDTYRGRVTHHSEIVGITLDGWKVRRTVTVIDLGKSAALPAKTGEELMEFEYMPGDEAAQQRAATVTASRDRRHNEIRMRLADYLRAHGPTPVRTLMPVAGYRPGNNGPMAQHFAYFPDVYQRFWDVPAVWGLIGQTYTPPPKPQYTPRDFRLRDALLEHGPLTEKELCKVSGIYHTDAQRGLKGHPELFAIVGYRAVLGQKISRKWGIVGVHDQEAT